MEEIRALFPIVNNDVVQLNSGSAGVMPMPVQEKLFSLIQRMNAMPPYEAFARWQDERTNSKQRIANMLGVTVNELAFVRNTTEGLNNVLFGVPLKKEDEIIYATCDYPLPINSIKQRVEREGVKGIEVQLNLLKDSDEEIVDKYKSAITGNTKLILISHITYREGHILPVKKICKMAHEHGVEVLLDAAHSFAHIEHSISDLGCDYYATSLHKWLNAPHGTGLLYVAKDKISKIYPLAAADDKDREKIIKFEYIGTRSFAHELGIGSALDFLELTGLPKKQDYLQELKMYWTERVRENKSVNICTDLRPTHSCALASFAIKDISPSDILKRFQEEFKLHIKATGYKGNRFLRVTPNIFNSIAELDRLVSAINVTAKHG